jgi:hypothetical protein
MVTKRSGVLFVCVENIKTTGILESMVVIPALMLKRKYDIKIGFTSMFRNSELSIEKIKLLDDQFVLEGRRSEQALSFQNVFLHITFFFKIFRLRKEYKVFHCRSYMATFIGLLVKALTLNDIKVIFDVRGLLIEETVEVGKISYSGVSYTLLKLIEKILFKYSDEIIAVSENMEGYIMSNFKRKAIVIRNPTSGDFQRFNLPKLERCIVYSGSLNKWHLPELAFRTFELLMQEYDFNIVVYTRNKKKANELIHKYISDTSRILLDEGSALEIQSKLATLNAIGWTIQQPKFSKRYAWPVKFTEYYASGIPSVVNTGIGDLDRFVGLLGVGVVIDSDKMDCEEIARQIDVYYRNPPIIPKDKKENFDYKLKWEFQIEKYYEMYFYS